MRHEPREIIYNKLTQNYSFNQFLRNFQSNAGLLNLTFKIAPIESGSLGILNPINTHNFEIIINQHWLNNQYIEPNNNPSDVEIAQVFLHESIHALLQSYLAQANYTPSTLEEGFPALFEYYANHQPNPQHEFMAAYYVNLMAQALYEFQRPTNSVVRVSRTT